MTTRRTPIILARGRRGVAGATGATGAPGDTNPGSPSTDILRAAWYLAAIKVTTGDSISTVNPDVRYHVELPDFINTGGRMFYLETTGLTLESTTAYAKTIKSIFSGYVFNGVLSRLEHYDITQTSRPMGAYMHSVTGNLVIWFEAGNSFTTFDVRGKRVGNGTHVGQSMNGIISVTETGVTL